MTSDAAATVKAVRNAARTLERGITTVRDLGGRGDAVIQVARGVERGLVRGPRILAAGRALTVTGGHGHSVGFAREVDGPDAVRKAVREEIRAGAIVIKVIATGGVLTPGIAADFTAFTQEELDAAVDEAHAWGRVIGAHAIGSGGDRPRGDGRRGLDRARVDAERRGREDDEGARDLPRADDLGDPGHRGPRGRGPGVRGREGHGAGGPRARCVRSLDPRPRSDRVRHRRRHAVQRARQRDARDRPDGRVGADPAPSDAGGYVERRRAAPAGPRPRRRGRRGRPRALRRRPARADRGRAQAGRRGELVTAAAS